MIDEKRVFYIEEIERLRKERDALLLVHNYLTEDIQLLADELGDSLDLSKKAAAAENDIILFAGVSFMAESAKVLAADKTVLHPVKEARCPMADMINAEKVRELKKKNPDAAVIAYINTNAETKMEVDAVCTSANAVTVARNIPAKKIIFLPDVNLGRYVREHVPGKEVILYNGFCRVHEDINPVELTKVRQKYPHAIVLTHPEANEPVCELSDELLGTGGMLKYVAEHPNDEYIIGTEEGMIQRLRREFPDKKFYPAQPRIICANMKKITLKDIYLSLKDLRFKVELPEEMIKKSLKPLENMFKYGV